MLAANLATPAVVAAAFARPLRTALGTSQVDVTVESWPPPALWWGRVDRMTVLARDVPAGDLRFERFRASFLGLRVDPRALYADRTLVIRAIGTGVAQASIAQAVLASALSRQPGVRIDELVVRRGGVTVRGTIRIFGADVAVTGEGALVLNGPDAIDLIVERGTVAGVASPSAIVKGHVAARVPSVVRVPPLPLGLRVTAVQMEDGRLLVDASTGPQ